MIKMKNSHASEIKMSAIIFVTECELQSVILVIPYLEETKGKASVQHEHVFWVSNNTKLQYVFDHMQGHEEKYAHTLRAMSVCLLSAGMLQMKRKDKKGERKKARAKQKRGNERKIANESGIKNDTQNKCFIWVTGLINFSMWSPKKPGLGRCQKNKCQRWKEWEAGGR